jgi:putative oxygen-independent coproporphyrinogen III oxidase
MQSGIPLSLYVHIPWCVKKCPYCDFNSHEKNATFDEARYIDALLIDLDDEYEKCQGRPLRSIFFGGGTPSLFSAESIGKIIERARHLFRFEEIEITLEANPGTFEQEKFTDFKHAGINRLSIGIQTFNREHLQTLGRIHDDRQALAAVDTARKAGLENINLDLMFGLPQQSTEQALADIETACHFEVPHISHYQLTIEANTYFHKHTPVLPESDDLWEMQIHCQQHLAEQGYRQYEISAYSQPGRECLHNTNYWQFGDYIGIGAGAHGKLTQHDNENGGHLITRNWKHRQPQQYMDRSLQHEATSGQQLLKSEDIVFEYLLNALRLKEGTDINTFMVHTGLKREQLTAAVKNIDPDLISLDNARIKSTDRGFLFLNDILENLV